MEDISKKIWSGISLTQVFLNTTTITLTELNDSPHSLNFNQRIQSAHPVRCPVKILNLTSTHMVANDWILYLLLMFHLAKIINVPSLVSCLRLMN